MKKLLFFTFLSVMLLLTACSNVSREETQCFGQVTSVNGDSITIKVANPPMQNGGGNGGMVPRIREGQGDVPANADGGDERPRRSPGREQGENLPPEGSSAPNRQNGQARGSGGNLEGEVGNLGGVRGMQFTGEEKTIKLSKDTKILIRQFGTDSTEGTLSDITEGTNITVSLKGNKAVSVSLMQFLRQRGDSPPAQ